MDNFGKILESSEAVEYLERTGNPRFELAMRKTGVDENEIIDLISGASDNIQLALSDAFSYRKSKNVQRVVRRLGTDMTAILNIFPTIKSEVLEEMQEDAGTA